MSMSKLRQLLHQLGPERSLVELWAAGGLEREQERPPVGAARVGRRPVDEQRPEQQHRARGNLHRDLALAIEAGGVGEEPGGVAGMARSRAVSMRSGQHAECPVAGAGVVEEDDGGSDDGGVLTNGDVPVRVVLVVGELGALLGALEVQLRREGSATCRR